MCTYGDDRFLFVFNKSSEGDLSQFDVIYSYVFEKKCDNCLFTSTKTKGDENKEN